MQSARDKLTRKIVEAEDLWKLNVVEPKGYECWGGGIDIARVNNNRWQRLATLAD